MKQYIPYTELYIAKLKHRNRGPGHVYRPAVDLLPLLPLSPFLPPSPSLLSTRRPSPVCVAVGRWVERRESIATVIRIPRSGGRGHVGSTAMGVQHYSHTISGSLFETMPSASRSRCFLEYAYLGNRVASKWIAVASGRIGLHSRPRPRLRRPAVPASPAATIHGPKTLAAVYRPEAFVKLRSNSSVSLRIK